MRCAVVLVLALWAGCSFTHTVRVENVSDAPLTIAYKIRPGPWKHGMFMARPVVWRKQGQEAVRDTSVRMDPADSVITLTLAPGDEALLAHCMNCTMEGFTRDGSVDAWADEPGRTRLNLYWMRIEHRGTVRTYAPRELVQEVTKNKLQRTVLRVKGS